MPLSTVPRFHAVTWLAWALAAVVIVQLASSPLYVTLVLAASALVAGAHRISSTGAFRLLVVAGIVMALIRVVLTALTTHAVGTVLFTLPEATLPRILGGFTIGGTIEKEVVLQSLAEGYAIVALLGVFGAFNSVVSHHELLGSAPRAFHEAGLVVTIAAAFVPSTVASWQGAREADRARTGGIVRRRGRLARTVVPVLETGMERSLRLADSMDSRGFARHPPGPADTASAWGALAGPDGPGRLVRRAGGPTLDPGRGPGHDGRRRAGERGRPGVEGLASSALPPPGPHRGGPVHHGDDRAGVDPGGRRRGKRRGHR